MMRLSIILIALVSITLSCNKEVEDTFDSVAQYQADLELIDQYITDNNITDTLHHSTGIRYIIQEEGTGIRAFAGDKLRVSYEGRFLSGEVFDSNESFDFILNAGSVIAGWYQMCQEMREGDTFTIFLPSLYGYGRSGSGSIPPNTVLVFDITLIRVGE
jgi:FKBP-type peptidyl-prolyl cis-trans isomerase